MQKIRKSPSAAERMFHVKHPEGAERMFHVKHPEGIRSFRII